MSNHTSTADTSRSLFSETKEANIMTTPKSNKRWLVTRIAIGVRRLFVQDNQSLMDSPLYALFMIACASISLVSGLIGSLETIKARAIHPALYIFFVAFAPIAIHLSVWFVKSVKENMPKE